MKKLVLVSVLVVLAIGLSANAAYVETFSSDNAGWLLVKQDSSQTLTGYSNAGGNSGGYISCSLTPDTPLVFGLNPTNMWGGSGTPETTWANLTDEVLTVDFKVSGTFTAQDGGTPMVRFYFGSSSTYFVTKDAYSWNPTNETNWTTHQVLVSAENFDCMIGTASFADTAANVIDIGMQFGPSSGVMYSSVDNLGFAGDATLMMDNFGTIPEPATMALLGLGGLLLGRKK